MEDIIQKEKMLKRRTKRKYCRIKRGKEYVTEVSFMCLLH